MLRLLTFATLSLAYGAVASDVDIYFAPYDDKSVLAADMALIQSVTQAAQADSSQYNADLNPYRIQFSVYNLLDTDYLDALVAAWEAGVYVQVLVQYTQLQQDYVPTYGVFKDAGMLVAENVNVTQMNLTAEERNDLNLIGIDSGGLMHMKMRYYQWGPDAENRKLLTGSLNPEDTGLSNDETLLHVTNEELVDLYLQFYNATRWVQAPEGQGVNVWDPSVPVHAFYSQWDNPVRMRILDLIDAEDEAIFVSVYALRNLEGESWRDSLVMRLCAAVDRGVPVVALTDKGESDGEGNFTTGDKYTTAMKLWQCGIPTYKCDNNAGMYTAFHHKNALFGLRNSTFVTDTANWSSASLGMNGTTPINVETTMIVESGALDGGLSGLRMLSNILRSLRVYQYQQHCPYTGLDGSIVTDNCATDEPYDQPDWEQPAAAEILAFLVRNASASWPYVTTTFSAPSEPDATAVQVQWYDGSLLLDLTATGAATVDLPMGLELTATVLKYNTALSVHTVVVDAAWDWENLARRSDDELASMSVVYEW